jgi:hypothetical protein
MNGEGRRNGQDLVDDLVPAIKSQPGCAGATFFTNKSDGESGLIVMWDSKDDADAEAALIGSWLSQGLQGNVEEPPTIGLFEVIKS